MKTRVLIVDDEKRAVMGIKRLLEFEKKYTIDVAFDGYEAMEKMHEKHFHIVITDYKMPGMNGLELLEAVKKDSPDTEVIVVTAYDNEVGPAVEAMKMGAFDYITKPIRTTELMLQMDKAMERQELVKDRDMLQASLDKKYGMENIIGQSPQMQEVFETIRLVAPTNTTVLISGESGTGKELVAEAVHRLSTRKKKPQIKVHCAALPATLLESELFGHTKGAFTGATTTKPGRFELADRSTMFLDEISEIEPHVQVKLLRVLQEQEFERVGGIESVKVDVRLIAATNKNLKSMVEKGDFREDLYYRFKVVEIKLPALRERVGDIPLFIDHFIRHFANYHNKEIQGVSSRAKKVLYKYSWPGNIRQLKNTIESMVVLARQPMLDLSDIPDDIYLESHQSSLTLPLGLSLAEAEKNYIIATLQNTGFNKAKAAQILDIGRKTLYRKLSEYDFEIPQPAGEESGKKDK